jgi:hypothetical protein
MGKLEKSYFKIYHRAMEAERTRKSNSKEGRALPGRAAAPFFQWGFAEAEPALWIGLAVG